MSISNLSTRLISSIAYALLFIYVIIHQNPYLLYIFTAVLCVGSIRELMQFKKMPSRKIMHVILSLYVIISLTTIIIIKSMEYGEVLLLILISQVWASDLGGYLIGSFGRYHFSKISPKKTYEGLIGSLVFCLLTLLITRNLIASYLEIDMLKITLLICASSIIGDLIMSKVKRLNHKKHSGLFLPGHGGFIDRLDSLFFAAPAYYLNMCI